MIQNSTSYYIRDVINHCIADSSSHLKVSIIVPTAITITVHPIAGASAAAFPVTSVSAVVDSVGVVADPVVPVVPALRLHRVAD